MTGMRTSKKTNHTWILAAMIASALPFMAGAQECGSIEAVTSKSVVVQREVASSHLNNKLKKTVYLPGCATFNYERWDASLWRDMGPNRICVWEGNVQPLQDGASVSTDFSLAEAGTYRLHYRVGLGCDTGVPMSRADCSSFRDVYTSSFQVRAPTCEEVEADCDEMDGVFNSETCTCCRAGAHQVQACEYNGLAEFDYLDCECHCIYTQWCPFGQECDGGECIDSECHEGNPPGNPAGEEIIELPRECPEGYGCMFGDGVDLYHGNGWCVEEH